MSLYLGIDVGTGSARAGLFDAGGKLAGSGSRAIQMWRDGADFVEQSSADIWAACGAAVGKALAAAGARPEHVRGIGFDATCSLVTEGATASPSGDPQRDVIVWMDHRATAQAARIDATRHPVLRHVGGSISPEMQTPKLLWLAEQLPASFAQATRFFDLADYLAYRATGSDARSLCTTVCKWTYLAHAGGWQPDYFQAIGLGALAGEGFRRIGTDVRALGERQGDLSPTAASELGLAPGIAVGVAMIDAHAGGLGMLGTPLTPAVPLERRLALVGGTSTCHLAVARDPRFVPGVWGPYMSALVPGMWLAEGGQSATGALIDYTIRNHARGAELADQAKAQNTSVYALLNARLDDRLTALARDVHVLPDHHGNRSPRADASLRGVVSGLSLADSLDDLAVLYLATIQGLAHGTRHIADALTASGFAFDVALACGGDTKNPVFLREHADALGMRIVLPAEPEAVLLGAAILGVVASGDRPSLEDAMSAMARVGQVVEPRTGEPARFHAAKHAVFLRMHDDYVAYRALMRS